MPNNVYINSTSSFFPNDPVSNDEMEVYLGYIDNRPSKSKNIVLRNNGIVNRYYALDKSGKSTHTNAQMTTLAVKELLRWMLSDGASAFLMSDKPNDKGLSLRIDWIEGVSYANEMDTCMYMGGEKQPDGTLKGFMDYTPEEIMTKSIFSVKQD